MRRRQQAQQLGGLLTLAMVILLILAGPITMFVAGFILFLIWPGLLLVAMLRAMVADIWSRLSRLRP